MARQLVPSEAAARGASQAWTVIAKEFRFAPDTLDVTAGQKVTFEFQNQDTVDHNVLSPDGALREVILWPGQPRTVEWTAPARAGTVKLVCTYHRGMEITLHVK